MPSSPSSASLPKLPEIAPFTSPQISPVYPTDDMNSGSPSQPKMNSDLYLRLDAESKAVERLPDSPPLTPVDTSLRSPGNSFHVISPPKSCDGVDKKGEHGCVITLLTT